MAEIELAKTKISEFLKSRCSLEFKILKAFSSFVTGLQYFPNAPKLEYHHTYICKRFNNPKFPNSIKIYHDLSEMGYVPKDLANTLVPDLDDHLDNRVLLCFCQKSPTKFSASCIYMLMEIVQDSQECK